MRYDLAWEQPQSVITWNSSHTDDEASRFQAYMHTPSSNAIATRPDRSYYLDDAASSQVPCPMVFALILLLEFIVD
jgi:hypothetical protein